MRTILRMLAAASLTAIACGHAFAETDAEWRPSGENDPTTCKTIWQGVGLPSGGAADKTSVCHDRFVLSHDNASKTPDWVLELLTKAELTNKFGRPSEAFSPDPRVPPRGRPEAGDYAGTTDKFEIGHQAPSEDFNNNQTNMRDTFVYSNAVPQAGDRFNAAIWKTLETEVRKAAIARGKLHVITGPVRTSNGVRTIKIAKADNACGGAIELDAIKTALVCKAVNKRQASQCDSGVVVPVALYKIVYDPERKAAFAFVMPNRNHPIGLGKKTYAYLEEWRVDVGEIEKLTGLQFFTDLPPADREKLVTKCEQTQLWAAAALKKKTKPPLPGTIAVGLPMQRP